MKFFLIHLLRRYTLNFPIRKGKFPVILLFKKLGLFRNAIYDGVLGNHTKIQLDLNDWVQNLIFFFRIYEFEKNETRTWLSLVENNSVILDIGANIGYYSLLATDKFPEVKVYAFEPAPKTFDSLKNNINLNGYKNISAYNIGISDREGVFDLYLSTDANTGMTSLAIPGDYSGRKVSVQVECIDEFRIKEAIPQITLVKIDVEGNELNVLHGMTASISSDRPVICIEIMDANLRKFNHSSKDVFDFFTSNNYSCYECTNQRTIRKVTTIKDIGLAFFVPVEKEKKLKIFDNTSVKYSAD